MLKLESLRSLILTAVPRYQKEPEQVIVVAKGGRVISSATDSLSHELHYTVEAWVLSLSEHPDRVMLPILAWHKMQQPELYAQRDANGFTFETQLLDDRATHDLHIALKITERVIVQHDAATGQVIANHHVPEPRPLGYGDTPERWQLDLLHPDGEREHIAEFDGPALPRAMAYLGALGITV